MALTGSRLRVLDAFEEFYRALLPRKSAHGIELAEAARVGELVALEIDNWCEADRAFVVKGKGPANALPSCLTTAP